jgi:hypothetical protein
MGKENITITLSSDKIDLLRKQAIKEYRTINKHISYLIDLALNNLINQKG